MWSPHEHAAGLGLEVAYTVMPDRGRYYPAQRLILLQRDLHPIVERCTLAHELGHHYRGPSEDRADQWAASFLVRADDVVQCAIEHPENPERWADRLNVIPRMLCVWLADHTNFARAERLYLERTPS